MELKETNHDPFTTTDMATVSEAHTLVKEKADSDASDFDDTALPADMYKAKAQTGVRGQETNQASKQGLKAAAGSGARSRSSTTESKVKNVTTRTRTTKSSREGTKMRTASDIPKQTDQNNEYSMLPVLKDQSTTGSLSATSPKSKIPKRSTSDSDVKSPVTPDKPLMSDVTSSSKMQKQTRTKESSKSPVTPTKSGRKPSFEEAKGGKSVSGDISPTKSTYKAGTKLIKEKSDDNIDSVTLVNGVEKEHKENNASLATKTRLPISFPTRKKNDDSITNYKTNVKNELDKPKRSPEQLEAPAEERPGSETPPLLPEGPKGKENKVISQFQDYLFEPNYST